MHYRLAGACTHTHTHTHTRTRRHAGGTHAHANTSVDMYLDVDECSIEKEGTSCNKLSCTQSCEQVAMFSRGKAASASLSKVFARALSERGAQHCRCPHLRSAALWTLSVVLTKTDSARKAEIHAISMPSPAICSPSCCPLPQHRGQVLCGCVIGHGHARCGRACCLGAGICCACCIGIRCGDGGAPWLGR